MGIKVIWDDGDKLIVRYIFEANWTVEDLFSAAEIGRDMYQQSPHEIMYVISDLQGHLKLPRDLLWAMRRLEMEIPEKMGFNVIVGAGSFVESMIKLFSKVVPSFHRRLRLAESVESARDLIAQEHAKLKET